MKRIFHPWDKWEDFRYNFYGTTAGFKKTEVVKQYAQFLRDIPAFDKALNTILNEWPYSMEHNLSNESMNRIAYLGQAAMALVYKVPHDISCGGYNLLTQEEKNAADAKAQEYLNKWIASREDVRNVG
jgi:hypothetical protein